MDRTSASGWLIKAGVNIVTLAGDARRPESVKLSDLRPEVRRSVLERDIAAAGLPLGTYDEAAHQELAQATPKMRDVAERKAAIARDLMTLGAGVGEPNARKLAAERRRIGERIGMGNMLLVDEAQYMVAHNEKGANNWRALEWLRAMADECGVNIALIGDLYLLGMEAALPQLWGRVSTNRPVIIRETAKADVEAIAASFRISEATSLQVLRRVSKRGGLRQVANVCRHSWVISGGQPPRSEDIGAAVEDLKVFDMRGK